MKIFKSNNIAGFFKGEEGWLNLLLGCVWGFPLLVIINAIFVRLPGLNEIGGYARDFFIFVIFLLSFRALQKRILLKDIIFCFLFFVFYLVQFIIYPENQEYLLENMSLVFLVALPMYFIGYALDINKLYNLLLAFSIGCILFHGFLSFIYMAGAGNDIDNGSHSMGIAYRMLPHVLYVFWHFSKTRNIYSLALFVLGLLLMFSYGTRGPMVCSAFFIVFLILTSGGWKKLWLIFLIVAAASFIVYYFDEIIFLLDAFFTDKGGNRIISQIYNDSLDDDSGRSFIIENLRTRMNYGDEMSYGIFGSYRYVNTYAHRIYWDFWFSFGYIGGSIIMLVLAAIFVSGRKKCITSEEKVFWLLLFSNSIVGLMFSNCYIFDGTFYLFLGYCVSRIRNNKVV